MSTDQISSPRSDQQQQDQQPPPSSPPHPTIPSSLDQGRSGLTRPLVARFHPSSHAPPPSTSSISSTPSKLLLSRASNIRRNSLPLSFPPLFSGPANTSSASLIPSTAEGRPIPLDNSTAAHRTTALRVLNSAYPSQVNRHRHTKSTGAKSTTYSQPVLVRTYSGPSHSQSPYNATSHRYRPPSSSRGDSRRIPLPPFGRTSSSLPDKAPKPSPIVTSVRGSNLRDGLGRDGDLTAMPRQKATTSGGKLTLSLPWKWGASSSSRPSQPPANDLGRLPPVEAFSFKHMMQEEDQGGETIGSDLDRIAEILERSKYSLSNQYEVHMAPHGSGASFVADVASTNGARSRRRKGHGHSRSVGGGPTLQAIGSDDEARRRRRGGGRRRSVAYGTLETIMSSSRSSEEDKSKKKPAAEIADEVRGRAAAKKISGPSAGSGSGAASNAANSSPGSAERTQAVDDGKHDLETKLARKKSTSFATAVMDSRNAQKDVTSPRASAAALVSEPALPRTSTSHIEIQTADVYGDSNSQSSRSRSPQAPDHPEPLFPDNRPTRLEEFPGLPSGAENPPNAGLLSSLSSWVPWRTPNGGELPVSSTHRSGPSHAEGSLRQLLKAIDPPAPDKGKGVDNGQD